MKSAILSGNAKEMWRFVGYLVKNGNSGAARSPAETDRAITHAWFPYAFEMASRSALFPSHQMKERKAGFILNATTAFVIGAPCATEVRVTTGPTAGTLKLSAKGLVHTPKAGFKGKDKFCTKGTSAKVAGKSWSGCVTVTVELTAQWPHHAAF